MGMFDKVIAVCIYCKDNVEFQSKAGDCELKEYYISSVPPEIAKSLNGQSTRCKSCGKEITIVIDKTIENIPMRVTI